MSLFSKALSFYCNKTTVRNLSNFRKITNWYANLQQPSKKQPPYSHVIQIGDPILRQKASPVPKDLIKTSEMELLLNNLRIVMYKYNCVGLSAPQLGIPLRVFVMEFNPIKKTEFSPEIFRNRKMGTFPFTAFINPILTVTNYNKIVFPESCESVKGYSADVPRFDEIEIAGFNEFGEPVKLEADGWTARIIQHEMDHLDGIIFTDVMHRKTLNCTCWQVVNERGGKVELPFSP